MNSYPPELLAQLAPVMFVAGPQSPAPKSQDSFSLLALRLKDMLQAQRRPAVWHPDKAKTFQVIFVDPDVRFPPRKMPPAEDQQFLPTHSPLSPLTPSSPLYPDGLIAPIWIRKHTSLVPSVFVLFKRIFEYQRPSGGTPLDVPDPDLDREREAEERRRDTELAQEIAQRKKLMNERSIKLTVVLMASRRMLDDSALDTRLTYIRRQSGLDPRAALFVLSPVAPSEIGDFVRSLQEALWEPALEYYTNHSKRVRRKRNRHTQAVSTYTSPISAPGSVAPRPLRPEGWTVRYEYKMACFAEFRGEDEVALKHYQDAYSALQVMFGSTAILPPRTKRWAEARVLADSLAFKTCKLYLYNHEHSLALAYHSMHMRRFSDLCRGWGIGEETFEFWGWVARQHRAFAELLEQGARGTLKIPTYLPSSSSAASTVVSQPLDSQRGMVETESLRSLGLNPTQALQHPGFYYYMAARCTESRRARFLHFTDSLTPENAASTPPSFENERKVDHLAIILELYTRSYELFKKYSPTNAQNQGRQTLWIAYRIAQTYYESGKFDMAARFFERIAKTYRREKWDAMLVPLLSTWFKCAQQLGDMELSVQLLFEMLAQGAYSADDEPDAIQEDLLAVLKSTVPTDLDHPLVIDLLDAEPLLDSSLVFWASDAKVDESTAFQLSLCATSRTFISSLPFSLLTIHFDEESAPVTVLHKSSDPDVGLPLIQRVDLGQSHVGLGGGDVPREVEADLRWRPGGIIVLVGTLVSTVPTNLTISKLVLTVKESSWWIELPVQPISIRNGIVPTPRWLTSLEPPKFLPIRRDPSHPVSHVTVRPRPHSVQVVLSHHSPPYLGEEYPIIVEVTNTDDRELEIVADAMLHPSEAEYAVNSISSDKENWTNLIKGVSFGTLAPGVSTFKTVYLQSAGAASDTVIDVSIRSRVPESDAVAQTSPLSPKSPSPATDDTGETLRTLVLQTVDPIIVKHDVAYRRSMAPRPGLADLVAYEPGFGVDGIGAEATVCTVWTCTGPHGIKVESAKLVKEDGSDARVISCALDVDSEGLLSEWLPGDEFSDCCRAAIGAVAETADEHIPGPGAYEITWRRILPDGGQGSLATSRFPLPPLKPPADELVALLDVPTQAKLHVPVQMRLTVRNLRQSGAANVVVQIEFDPSDGFVLAGLRSGRIPVLLPGSEEALMWNMIPIECGYARVPRIRVTDRRTPTGGADAQDSEGEALSVVDDGHDRLSGGSTNRKGSISDGVVLVLP
ncbi:uncharacterized protein PHACADRAFT_163712 [Phanerochaete carnosa HHB-10118-sp]|uniref:Trafficking protein particle complex subunit 11 n=1 Tax=Phanerochaete carnosa (strain HHB-10118-sp) TaxID=650164 RepID=K5WSN0_PHACS|nr:uncharacterized protein PHACADRAFT_163712 [Phanerochaete carnosa HHB-10118-sp]EKM53402.1 hypothetical protein PHACADRAFT_163712 [Phanerochaete carnosa HHB-10118-sp]